MQLCKSFSYTSYLFLINRISSLITMGFSYHMMYNHNVKTNRNLSLGGFSMNIAICEDELIYATGMQIAIQTWVQSRNYTDIQILLYSSAEDLWDDWERGKVFDALHYSSILNSSTCPALSSHNAFVVQTPIFPSFLSQTATVILFRGMKFPLTAIC